MTKQCTSLITLIALALSAQVVIRAQDASQKPAADRSTAAAARNAGLVSLKVQVTISKYQGEKKISSLPYSISVNANGPMAMLRMGSQVPYVTAASTGGDKPTPSFTYRQVGVNIDTNASTAEGGQFRIDLKIDDTSVAPNTQMQGAPIVGGVPVFRTFSTTHTVLLKDGQTAQLIAATDPVSGDVTRVDVTLTVVK